MDSERCAGAAGDERVWCLMFYEEREKREAAEDGLAFAAVLAGVTWLVIGAAILGLGVIALYEWLTRLV